MHHTMQAYQLIVFALFVLAWDASANLCKTENYQTVGRVVFGEARGEPVEGQRAVAFTIVNRIKHVYFPKTIDAVVKAKRKNGKSEYETMDNAAHTQNWNNAKSKNTQAYRNAIKVSEDVLCGKVPDPTKCAVNFCGTDPCPSTDSNKYWEATNKVKIGKHYFVCLVKKN